MGTIKVQVLREGTMTDLSAERGANLLDTLRAHDIYVSAACGGQGKCGKCKVRFILGAAEISEADRQFFTQQQLEDGWRLACLASPRENCSLQIPSGDESDFEIVSDYREDVQDEKKADAAGYDIGIDIGTTTIAVDLIGRSSGTVLCTHTLINHQRAYGADVISRIQASNEGKKEELKESIRRDLYEGIYTVLSQYGVSAAEVSRIAIAGNTTMGHLLMGYSCETLGVYPFTPVNVGTIETTFAEMFGSVEGLDGSICPAQIILLPGITTYVGADISAGMLCCDFEKKEKPCLLIDLGTNGEMALGNKEKILVTSTAAGPAFEGGNISCGMGSVKGAICQVDLVDGEPVCRTIGDKAPIGLCGTGVIESVSALVREEIIDETGMLDEDYFDDGYELARTPEGEPIVLTQKDVREIQLAKSAVRAGAETLMLRYGVSYDDIETVYLAGGFGYRMNIEKAVSIGLLPEELQEKIIAVGNSSLGGAVAWLTEANAPQRLQSIIDRSEEIELSSDKDFNQFYTDYMFFE